MPWVKVESIHAVTRPEDRRVVLETVKGNVSLIIPLSDLDEENLSLRCSASGVIVCRGSASRLYRTVTVRGSYGLFELDVPAGSVSFDVIPDTTCPCFYCGRSCPCLG